MATTSGADGRRGADGGSAAGRTAGGRGAAGHSAASRKERRREEIARRREERKERVREGAAVAVPDAGPDWLLFVPAFLGVLLSGYLGAVEVLGTTPAACGPDSGCSIVQASRWASLGGIPTAVFGLGAYLALVAIALGVRRPGRRWALAAGVAGFGLAASVYLTAVSVFALEATCPWCLGSLALMTACFGVVVARWPREVPGAPRPGPWLAGVGIVAAAALVPVHLHYQGVFDPTAGPADPTLRALAVHLRESGARFYGASWCPHCQHQKEMFGGAARELPYVECSPEGRGAPQAEVCAEAAVRSYPTWIIDGERHAGVLSPRQLALYSGFDGAEGTSR